jgi:hypothetical protein
MVSETADGSMMIFKIFKMMMIAKYTVMICREKQKTELSTELGRLAVEKFA